MASARPPSRPRPSGTLVYSTDGPVPRAAPAPASAPAGDGVARVRRETGGRGGKTVTTVRGVPLAGDALAAFAKRLKAACGTGGTLKDGVLELQGDHRERVVAALAAEGIRAKLAGG
jgi:translation initiation factor 1